MSRRAAWARRGLRAGIALDLLAADDLGAPDALAVLAVAIRGRLTPADLARLGSISEPIARHRLRGLARAGWIERDPLVECEAYRPLPTVARVAVETVAGSR